MSEPIIRVEDLSKAYRIGLKEEIPDTITSAALGWIRRPVSNMRRLKRLNTFQTNGDGKSEDIIWALKNVSFEVHENEVVGIIGSNGAGKSTLLKILTRITEPTSGRAIIHGRVSSLLEVGTGFHPELTGRENVYLNGTVLGMTKREIDRKFDEIVDFSGVEKFLDTPIKRYSSGMQVRLAFAVAAHLEPEILIIDEVLAVGDAEFQKKCIGKMQDVARAGHTVLFVSHNIGAITQLCDSAVLLEHGKFMGHGGVDAIVSRYSNAHGCNAPPVWTREDPRFDRHEITPLRMALVDETGARASLPIRNNRQYKVVLDLEIREHHPALQLGYTVFFGDQTLVFGSYHRDSSPDTWPITSCGHIRLTSEWPRYLLNEGIYRVEFTAAINKIRWILEPGRSVPSMRLEIAGGMSESPDFNSRRHGILAPVYRWTAEMRPNATDHLF